MDKIENCPVCGGECHASEWNSQVYCYGCPYRNTAKGHNRLCRQRAAGEELAKACPQLLNDRVCDVCIEDGCGEPVCDCQCHAEIDQTRAAVGNALAAYNAAKEPQQ